MMIHTFAQVNGTPYAETMTVKRGMQNVMDVGQVVMFDGKSKMDKYSGDPCNDIRGTDTTIFPPFMGRSDVWSFGAEICRCVSLEYKNFFFCLILLLRLIDNDFIRVAIDNTTKKPKGK